MKKIIKINQQLKNIKFYIMVLGDSILFCAALLLSYLFRFEFQISQIQTLQIGNLLFWIVPIKLVLFYNYGLYRGMWRYAGLNDLWKLLNAAFFSTLLIIGVILYKYRFENYSRAVFLLDGLLTFLLAGGIRLLIRSYFQQHLKTNGMALSRRRKKHIKKVLIIGAGNAGEKIFREIVDSPQLRYQVTGFLDDDQKKHRRTVHGVPVLGNVAMLPQILEKGDIQEVFIAIPSASGSQIRRIAEICKDSEISYKILPGLGEIIDGRVSIKELRDIRYEDLLGREPVNLNISEIESYLYDRTVMITGCGGSIGSELCRQLIPFHPQSLVLFDASEANLFQIQMELQNEFQFNNYRLVLGSVQDQVLLERVMKDTRPQVVFHAAAYKHVPMLEKNRRVAIFNNILGSKNLMESALEHGVERFVLVSSDKAVNPKNVMGATKRIAELLLQSFQGTSTRFMAVRFGNVLGSSGSVIPILRRQIEKGGPVTVTHPDMTRYFMSIPESAQLIIQAGALGKGGEIFVLEMGTPVKILDMAKDLIRLSGKEPDKDIKIMITGLREGEKMYEELLSTEENLIPTVHKKIMVLQDKRITRHGDDIETLRKRLHLQLFSLFEMAKENDTPDILRKLQEIVPEYRPDEKIGGI